MNTESQEKAESPENADRTIRGTGTSAQQWREHPRWQAIPVCRLDELVPAGRRLVVLAPHPDDEVLAAAGLLMQAVAAGRTVLVVAVTDGEASHPGSRYWPVRRLRAQRAVESELALRRLGLPPGLRHRWDLGDGRLTSQQSELRRRLEQLATGADVLVSPWVFDGHPDHEVLARCSAAVAASVGATHLQAPIWGWHWASPDADQLPWPQAVRLPLDEAAVEHKRSAISAFESQLERDLSTGAEPILPVWALDRLIHDREIFLR